MKKRAEEVRRRRAELYARLASIRVLEEIKESGKLKLVEDIQEVIIPLLVEPDEDVRVLNQQILFRLQHIPPPSGLKPPAGPTKEEASRGIAIGLLPYLFDWTHGWILSLLEDRSVPVRLTGELCLENGKVRLRHNQSNNVESKVLWDLYETLTEELFRRCPVCESIFVPVKKQKYCLPACTARGTAAGRKEKRREYMRQYMADKREKAKKARTGQKAT